MGDEENIHMLFNAVIEQAASDYIRALCDQHAILSWYPDRSDSDVRELESFFTGDNFNAFTKIDGAWLMRKLKDLVIECDYNIKAINKRRNGNGVGV